MSELEEKNKKYIEIKVNNVPMATQLLENVMKFPAGRLSSGRSFLCGL